MAEVMSVTFPDRACKLVLRQTGTSILRLNEYDNLQELHVSMDNRQILLVLYIISHVRLWEAEGVVTTGADKHSPLMAIPWYISQDAQKWRS